jgi:transcriptional regulator with XRE-family HTH domain
MKLETTQDLLERLRARFEGCSYYRLSKHLGISEPTIANWKHGRSGIGREHVTRVAEALGESAEYVLACVEYEREQDAGARKVWRRIAERFRSTASILLGAVVLVGLGSPTRSEGYVAAAKDEPPAYTYYGKSRRKLRRCLKPLDWWPIQLGKWTRARTRSTVYPRSCSRPSLAYT